MRPLGVLLGALLSASCATAGAAFPGSEEPIDADRPHVGTGTHLVSPGRIQLELGVQQDHGDGERRFASPALARIGASDRLELRLGTDGLVSRRGALDAQGLGNVQLSAKVPLVAGRDDPLLAAMPIVTFGTASTSKHLGSGSTDAMVVLLVGREVAPRLHVEFNYGLGIIGSRLERRRASQHLFTGAAVFAATPRLSVYGEGVGWTRQEVGGSAVTTTDVGAIYALRPRMLLDAGVTAGISDAAPRYGLFGGVSFLTR